MAQARTARLNEPRSIKPTGVAQISLAAAAVRSAGGMRRVPRMRWWVVTQTFAVDMTQHRSALGAARPVTACSIFAGREGAAIGLRAGESVMASWRVAYAGTMSLFLRATAGGELPRAGDLEVGEVRLPKLVDGRGLVLELFGRALITA
jgi:hypothetical protein